MGKNRHLLITVIAGLAIAALVVFLYSGLQHDPKNIPSPLLGKPALGFSTKWLQGQEFLPGSNPSSLSLSDLRGKNIVLNFWASWCHSCREEALDLQAYWEKYRDQGIVVIGIAIQDTEEAAREFAERYGKKYILSLDEDGKASIDYGVTGVPETFLINKEGIVVHKEVGPVTVASLEELMKKF
jgi:cytochrome c biogenesis protein CcmG/thiol:disulfide interchange protein DsbE